MSTYPSVISTISTPAASDKLNSPSHSGIESGQNDAILKLETFIGTQASAVGTLMYDIRATASDGGGHVQGVNKGGTGQTSYAKGDVLVASSSSVLTKLAVGSNDQALTADSAQAAGVKWAGVANAAAIQNQTYIYARASVMSGSVYGVKLPENPSILSDGLGLVIKFPAVPLSSLMALQIFTSSSGSVSALIKRTNLANPETTNITASMIGILEFDSVSSVFQLMNPAGIPTIGFPGTLAFSGLAPSVFTDLDLSLIVGVNKAIVSLRVLNNAATDDSGFSFRTKGDTQVISSDTWSAKKSGGTVQVNDGKIAYTWIITDNAGVVGWGAENINIPTSVAVISYIKA